MKELVCAFFELLCLIFIAIDFVTTSNSQNLSNDAVYVEENFITTRVCGGISIEFATAKVAFGVGVGKPMFLCTLISALSYILCETECFNYNVYTAVYIEE